MKTEYNQFKKRYHVIEQDIMTGEVQINITTKHKHIAQKYVKTMRNTGIFAHFRIYPEYEGHPINMEVVREQMK